MYDFNHYAYAPQSGTWFLLDELPPLHSTTAIARLYNPNCSIFVFSDRRYPCDLEGLLARWFPYDMPEVWKMDRVFILVDYLGCPILCRVDIDNQLKHMCYEKSKNNQAGQNDDAYYKPSSQIICSVA